MGELVPVQRRLVEFDPTTGEPVVSTVPTFTKAQIKNAILAAIALPYEPVAGDPKEESYRGLSNLEVMLIKQARNAARTGDVFEVEKLLDRVIDKPKQTSESVRVEVGYEDYLKEIARKAAPSSLPIQAAQVPEAVVVRSDDEDIFS